MKILYETLSFSKDFSRKYKLHMGVAALLRLITRAGGGQGDVEDRQYQRLTVMEHFAGGWRQKEEEPQLDSRSGSSGCSNRRWV